MKEKETIKVRIYRSENPNYWYSDRIGEEFEVIPKGGRKYLIIDDNENINKLIDVVDCVLPEEYPKEKQNKEIKSLSNFELHRDLTKSLRRTVASKKTLKKLDELYKRAKSNNG